VYTKQPTAKYVRCTGKFTDTRAFCLRNNSQRKKEISCATTAKEKKFTDTRAFCLRNNSQRQTIHDINNRERQSI
jgi:hypothetical protein